MPNFILPPPFGTASPTSYCILFPVSKPDILSSITSHPRDGGQMGCQGKQKNISLVSDGNALTFRPGRRKPSEPGLWPHHFPSVALNCAIYSGLLGSGIC